MMKKWHSCFDRFSTNGQSSTTRPYTNFEIKCVCPGIDGHGRPLERKLKIKVNKNGIGYMPTGLQRVKSFEGEENKPDIGEAFFMARECMLDANDLEESAHVLYRGSNQWPEDLPGFRETLVGYFEAMEALSLRLLPVYATALGLPAAFFDRAFHNSKATGILRLSPYPYLSEKSRGELSRFGKES
jgi:isopenicillin N synthase-like dioxygenase